VSSIDDPASATFCEPVEKANSSHSFTAGLAHTMGLRCIYFHSIFLAKFIHFIKFGWPIFSSLHT
jgi:hypothetical protein